MTRWIGVVAVPTPDERDPMVSRLPAYLHPVCGRPLIWHSVSVLLTADPAPEHVYVVGDAEFPDDVFQDVSGAVTVVSGAAPPAALAERDAATRVVVLDAAAIIPRACVAELIGGPEDAWVAANGGEVAAALSTSPTYGLPLDPPAGPRLDPGDVVLVRDRAGLAEAFRVVRDRVVRQLMRGGVTFILPESVTVDVDVSIGRDTVVYPGAIIEGQTTIGEETVIGPGCRVISSWIGSGVEMKGWNYIAHTSIRNRAILEPYVRRGFD